VLKKQHTWKLGAARLQVEIDLEKIMI